MADLKYKIKISHRDKGLGFNAKTALQNAQRQETSPIKQARFSGQPSSSNTNIEVTVDDVTLRDIITNTINSSGMMPKGGLYTIEGVELQEEDNSRMKDLQRESGALHRQLKTLREENAELRQSLTRNRAEVNTPLEGLLAYFETTNYSPEVILEDSTDLDFAQRVFSGDIENNFVNYANHVLGESLSEEEVERVLAYEPDEMPELHSRYETAMKELGFLEKLKSGKTEIPETLCATYIEVIEEKGHDETIREYESRVQEQKEVMLKQGKLKQLKGKYDSFSEQIDLLTQASGEVPVIFHLGENNVEVYFPFRVRDVKAGFIEDLRKEVETYFENATVGYLDSKFVAYRVNGGEGFTEGVDHLVEDTPVTLRVAGFNTIVPYRLG